MACNTEGHPSLEHPAAQQVPVRIKEDAGDKRYWIGSEEGARVREGDVVASALIQRSYRSSSKSDKKLYYFLFMNFAVFSIISVEAIMIQCRRVSPRPLTQGSGYI
jgi:hypothetical protein